MTNEEFDERIKAVFDRNPDFNPFGIELDFTPAKISRKTDRYVKKLANEMFCSPKPERYRRRFAMRYVALALIGASVLTVGAYAYCSKYVFTMDDAKMEEISIQSSVDDKTSIEEVYELTYNLNGYKLTSYSERESGVSTCYKKGTHLIEFSQRLISNDDMLVNTENAIVETNEINDNETIYIDSSTEYDDAQMLIWTYDGYEFILIVNAEINNRDFGKEDLIDMARSIQIKN